MMKSNTYKCTNAHAIKQTKELNLSFQVTEFGEELIQDDTIGLKTLFLFQIVNYQKRKNEKYI